jgi:flagellar basal-body rod protein FlgF
MRTTGLTSSASALRYWERRQEIVANNLANVDTSGFKAERVFARAVGDGLPAPETATDLRGGTLTQTGAPLDVALDQNQFLVVSTPNGERLSRGGSLRLDEAGHLTDAAGNPVLGERGVITVPPGELQIDATGTVSVDNRELDRLLVESVPTGTRLQHESGTLFVPPTTRQAVTPEARKVTQGFLESSNVNSINALVDMISVQRAYAAIQKAVITLDGIHGTAANELGKPV